MPHNGHMSIPQEDEGIVAGEGTPPERDLDHDGIVDDGLGRPAAPEDDGGGD